ncbi:hypothetical protein ACWDTD_08780 [Gordonia sp. NPDC003425]
MARPPRKKTGYTPRVAGHTRPVERAQNPVERAQDPVERAQDPVERAQKPVERAQERVERAQDPVDRDATVADKSDVVADKSDVDADKTDVDADKTDVDADKTEVIERPRPAGKTRPISRVSTLKPSETPPKAPGARTSLRNLPTPSSASIGFGPRSVAILAGIAALLAVVAVILALKPGADIGPNKAFIDQGATTELISQAQTKICAANSATGVKFDEWSAKARAGLTGEALDQFNKQVGSLKQVLEQAKATTDCQIDAIGVRDLTGDSDGSQATILVNMVISGTQNGVPTQSLTPRYQVQMRKQGDSWLIAKVQDV